MDIVMLQGYQTKAGLGSGKEDVIYKETCGVEFHFQHLPGMLFWASNLFFLG